MAAELTADAVYDSQKGAIIVSGTVPSARYGLYLTVTVRNPEGKAVYIDQMTLPASEESDKPYSFAPVVIHPKNSTGNYTISVSAEDVGTAKDIPYYFIGADLQHAALVDVKAAIDAQSSSLLRTALLSHADALGIDGKALEALGDDGEASLLAIMLDKTYEVPDAYDTDEKIDVIMASVTSLRTDYNNALAVGKYNDIGSTAELKSWLESYGDGFAFDDEATSENEKLMYDYVLDVLEEAAYATRISGGAVLYDMDDVGDTLYEQALLTVIQERHYSEARKVLEAFPGLFGLDLGDFDKLSSSEKGEVYENITGNYATYAAAGNAFDSLVDDKLEGDDDGGSSGNSNRGTKGSYTSSASGTSVGVTTPGQSASSFPDMANAVWATEAVNALRAKGIVAGDSYGNFNPTSYVTRAEFAKMMVVLTGLEPSYEDCGFNDVSSGDWFYAYVNAAAKSGLVLGDNLGNFNPNSRITREDMAVILYRAYGIGEDLGYTLSFADSDSIYDYAKEAVAFLNAKNVISGIGGNIFAPKNNATRAEAAQLLYNALSQIGK